jgi:hypothetical protein
VQVRDLTQRPPQPADRYLEAVAGHSGAMSGQNASSGSSRRQVCRRRDSSGVYKSKRNQVDPQRRPMESLLEATGKPAAAPAATLRSGSGTIRGSSGR